MGLALAAPSTGAGARAGAGATICDFKGKGKDGKVTFAGFSSLKGLNGIGKVHTLERAAPGWMEAGAGHGTSPQPRGFGGRRAPHA